MREKIKNNAKYLFAAYLLSFVAAFMLYIHEPILTYSANINDFWFDFTTMLPSLLMFLLLITVALILLYTVFFFFCCLVSKKCMPFKIILLISFVALIFSYIQGNYLVGSLPTLDGETIIWGNYIKENIISLVVATILVILEIIAIKKLKYDETIKINRFITFAILIMLTVSLVTRLTTTDIFKEKEVTTASNININNASNDKNFYIFLVDAVDSTEFEKAVEEEKENAFEDFTYYPDTVSAYLYTRDSIPFIFSGLWNENETEFNEYYNKAFENSELLDELEKEEYQINFYERESFLNRKNSKKFDNVNIYDSGINEVIFFKQTTKYVLFKYLPYNLKKFSKIETADFEKCKIITEDKDYFEWGNADAYERIKEEPLELIEEKYFQFIHIEGAHVPFDYDENVNRINEEEGTYEQKVKATLKIVKKFINKLKENNVYDNSVIMVMADHGYWASTGRQNPILYIKGIDEHHEMKISEKAISFENLPEAYIDLIKGKKSTELFENIGSDRTRRFILNAFEGEDEMIEYEQRGKAWDSNATVETGKKFIMEK